MEMPPNIGNYITAFTFRHKYGMWGTGRYNQFLQFVSEKLSETIDKETKLTSLLLVDSWRDQGGNVHASVKGTVARRNEKAEIGAEIVWLKRLKKFRGSFWSHLNPRSDADLLAEAKRPFYAGRYPEFLALARYIEPAYAANHVFKRMVSVAEHRA